MLTPDESPAGAPESGFQPPGTQHHPVDNKQDRRGLIWFALVIVVLLVLAVLLVLPNMVSEPGSNRTDVIATPQTVEPSPTLLTDSNATQDDALQAMQEYLRVQARLELANVTLWGEPEWSRALQGAERGNHHFSQRRFAEATDSFITASTSLLLLESELGARLSQALDSGWQALQADESVAAIGFFETAKAMDAGNLDALNGLERARVRPDLLQLMSAGESARAKSDLAGARDFYRQAVALDGVYEPALAALQKVSAEISDSAFRDAMSQAINALEAEQIEVAEGALRQAAQLRPDDASVQNTRAELARVTQKLWLEDQSQAASKKVSEENWGGAIAIYRKVLARNPQMGFARQGLEFAQDRERLHQQLDHYLQDPTRVYADQPRANAQALLASASNPPAAEPRLAEKIQRLSLLISEAETTHVVTLSSDGLTNVQIYHVGSLGEFTSQQLELRPGTYTVVGSRAGYRDARKTLTVKPGVQQQSLDIRCEESV